MLEKRTTKTHPIKEDMSYRVHTWTL